jgi:endonuclease/exonuclease/phosphatase family metal-dependent hydrolase
MQHDHSIAQRRYSFLRWIKGDFSRSGRDMRVLSWNIQWGRGIDGRVDLARTAAVIRDADADVVCLQEVAVNHPGLPGGAAEDQVARLGELLPGYASVYAAGSDLIGDMGHGQGGRRLFGQMLLSRLPLLQVFRHLLPFPTDPAVPAMQRVALEAVIAAPNVTWGPLRVVTTHLEYYSALQRAAQVEFLRELQALGHRHAVAPRSDAETDPPFAVLPRGEFAVFCGDFNCPAGAPEHARMQAAIAPDVPRLVDAWSIAYPAAPTDDAGAAVAVPPAPTFCVHDRGYLGQPACYDFFFVSANLAERVASVAVDGACTASDHQPIWLELTG